MKNRILYITTVIAIAFALASCNDSLEQVNPNGANSDTYWANLDETQASLNSVYASLLDHDLIGVQRESYRSDMAFPGQRDKPLTSMVPWYDQLYNSATVEVSDRWALCYRGIFRANQVIEGLTRLKGKVDEARWTEQMAQARFFRGLFHFYLHSSFNNGQIIIQDAYAKTINAIYKPLSSSEEVINFFRSDLRYAFQNLPYYYDVKGKVTKGTAATILGTSHLYQAEYDSAMFYFDDVIQNPAYGYKLVDDMSLLFTNAGDFNAESIFEISYSLDFNLEYTQWEEQSMAQRLSRYSSPTGPGEFVPAAWLTYAYQHESLDSTDSRNWVDDGNGGTRIRSASLRASAMVALPNDFDTKYYLRPYALEGDGVKNIFNQYKVAYFKQYTNHSIVADESDNGGSSWKSGKNVVVNRLAEVYLMAAECLIKKNDIEGAMEYMNDVRHRWALQLLGTAGSTPQYDGKTYDQTSLMNQLMYVDKPLECSVEGYSMRFIDMRRWGITKQRFEELSQQVWYFGNFDYVDPETGEAKTKKNCYLYKDEPANYGLKISEYEHAATNYQQSVYGYFPLPLSETLNNPYLSN